VASEDLCEEKLPILLAHYCAMAELIRKTSDLGQSHSVEEAIKDKDTEAKLNPSQ
jgi:hypothetical protein